MSNTKVELNNTCYMYLLSDIIQFTRVIGDGSDDPIIKTDTPTGCIDIIKALMKQGIKYIYTCDLDRIAMSLIVSLLQGDSSMSPYSYDYICKTNGEFINFRVTNLGGRALLEIRSIQLLFKDVPREVCQSLALMSDFLGDIKMTAPATALAEFKKTLDYKTYMKCFPLIDEETDEFVRRSYHGGYLYENFEPRRVYNSVTVYDVNSLYPHVMAHCYLPLKWLPTTYGQNVDMSPIVSKELLPGIEDYRVENLSRIYDTISEDPDYQRYLPKDWKRLPGTKGAQIFDALPEPIQNDLKIRDTDYCFWDYVPGSIREPKERYFFAKVQVIFAEPRSKVLRPIVTQDEHKTFIKGIDRFSQKCTRDMSPSDWKQTEVLYLSQDDFFVLIENYNCIIHMDKIIYFHAFKGIFDDFIKKFWDIKKEGGQYKPFAKIILNSLSGKLSSSRKYKNIMYKKGKTGEIIGEPTTQEAKYSGGYIPAGCAITSKARRILISCIKKQSLPVLYGDTDSVHILGGEAEGIRVSDELGDWKIEHRYDEVIYFTKKRYIGREGDSVKVTLSGDYQEHIDYIKECLEDGFEKLGNVPRETFKELGLG